MFRRKFLNFFSEIFSTLHRVPIVTHARELQWGPYEALSYQKWISRIFVDFEGFFQGIRDYSFRVHYIEL